MRSLMQRAAFCVGFLVALPTLTPLGAQDAPAWAARLDSLIAAQMQRTGTPGAQVAVAYQGRVIYSRGFGVADIETQRPVTAATLFRVGSVSKMFTGALLAQLSVEGKIDLRAPISRYVTELDGRRVGTVTTHQLLTHTAGWLDNAVAYGERDEAGLGRVMTVQGDTLFFTEPGRVISYSNPGFSMAGYVAERAGGAPFGNLIEDRVLRKVGMANATFRPLSAMTREVSQGHIAQGAGTPVVVRPYTENTAQWAAGFLFASAGELMRFAIALMDSGRIDGASALAPEAVRLMTTGDPRIPGDATARYAYGLNVGALGSTGTEPLWSHNGSINGFYSAVTMFPARRLAVAVNVNRSGAPLQGIVDLVAREVAGLTPPPPPPAPTPRTATAEERAKIVGTYRQGTTRLVFHERNDSLFARQTIVDAPVQMIGTDRLRIVPPVGPPTTVILLPSADGRIEYLSLGLRALAREP